MVYIICICNVTLYANISCPSDNPDKKKQVFKLSIDPGSTNNFFYFYFKLF